MIPDTVLKGNDLIIYNNNTKKFDKVPFTYTSKVVSVTGDNKNFIIIQNRNNANAYSFYDYTLDNVVYECSGVCVLNALARKNMKYIVSVNEVLCILNNKVEKVIKTYDNFNGCAEIVKNNIVTLGENIGEIKINDEIIKICPSEITKLKTNNDENLLAIVCNNGKSIKIYDVDNKKIIKHFVRGSKNAYVYDVAFSMDNKDFVCISDTGTLHFFDMEGNKNIKSWMSYLYNSSDEWSYMSHTKNKCQTHTIFTSDNVLHVIDIDENYTKYQGENYKEQIQEVL